VPPLRAQFATQANFELIEADALDTDFCELVGPDTTARVVANLPYNVATAVLQRLIEQRHCITEMVLMLQREVVERITAPPGSSERGFFSVFVEAYCEAEKVCDVPPRAFRPVPKVWSTVARLRPTHRRRCEKRKIALASCERGLCAKEKNHAQQSASRA